MLENPEMPRNVSDETNSTTKIKICLRESMTSIRLYEKNKVIEEKTQVIAFKTF